MNLKKSVRNIVSDNCANYIDGQCLPLDCACVQLDSMESLNEGKVLCTYFRDSVLPTDKVLAAEIAGCMNGKHCARCKSVFIPTGNRQMYCKECKDIVKKQKGAARFRKYYDTKHSSQFYA